MKALAAAAALVLLVGCGAKNTDPRQGRVVIDESNCAVGSCYLNWKVCIGPDLLIHIDDTKDKTYGERLIKDADQCKGWES